MISFYPGPSKVYPQIPQYVLEAQQQGLLSINHRSEEFVAMSARTIQLLKQRLNIPESYQVFFVSSATECWEIISQSLVQHASFHVYNGAFGEKWYDYARKLQPAAHGFSFGQEEKLNPNLWQVPAEVELLALTHNETSNGTAVDMEILKSIRQLHPQRLIAVDATSSMAGAHLDLSLADVWFASVQKCFGLPAGMALLICSPAAIRQANTLGENRHYNSLTSMIHHMQSWQTTHTPNVLNIYLLMRTLENREGIEQTAQTIQERYTRWMQDLQALPYASLLIKNAAVRSQTVIAVEALPEVILQLKESARKAGIILGNGYGIWKTTTFRIANFPAIETYEIEKLRTFLQEFR